MSDWLKVVNFFKFTMHTKIFKLTLGYALSVKQFYRDPIKNQNSTCMTSLLTFTTTTLQVIPIAILIR